MSSGILLTGLDGSNPLAFLAAIGALRTLTLALPQDVVNMRWEQHDSAWRPRLSCALSSDGDALISMLHDTLTAATVPSCFLIGDNLNLPAVDFALLVKQSIKEPDKLTNREARFDADFFAAFGSEAVVNEDGTMQDTALRTMSGAGHQHFLKFMRELISNTNVEQLRRTLLAKWDYADEGRGLNLRWDPLDDRRYALRWTDPSSDPVKTMRGANRLAIEALPLLPTMPTVRKLATTCCEGTGARDTYFIWPIWNVWLCMDVVASLLSQVFRLRAHPEHRAALGISGLFASSRITTGKFRNFTPGTPV